jgi:type VI secretion system secreted protein Hcp
MGVPLADTPATFADVFLFVKTKRAGAVKGEAVAKGHDTHIALDGFHFGVRASSAIGSGQATARRQYDSLRVFKRLDSATTSLLSALVTNDEVKEATLSLRKAAGGQDDFFTIKLEQARVVSCDIDCDERGNAIETIELAFAKIEVAYRVQTGLGIAGGTNTFSDEFSAAS